MNNTNTCFDALISPKGVPPVWLKEPKATSNDARDKGQGIRRKRDARKKEKSLNSFQFRMSINTESTKLFEMGKQTTTTEKKRKGKETVTKTPKGNERIFN